MDLGISTRCFGTTPLTLDLLDRLRRAEFTRIELRGALPGFNYQNRTFLRSVARWFAENGLPGPSLHLPFEKDVLAALRIDRQQALDEIKRCLELSDLLPLDFVVLHLGSPGQAFNPVVFEYTYTVVTAIQAFAGCRVLLETLPNDIATMSRIVEFRTAAQLPDIGICYDTGHGEIDGVVDAIHLNDSGDGPDDHLWPFEGKRNWPALVEQLVLSSYSGPMILEAGNERLEVASECRSRLRDLLDEAANSIDEFRLKYKLPFPKSEEEE